MYPFLPLFFRLSKISGNLVQIKALFCEVDLWRKINMCYFFVWVIVLWVQCSIIRNKQRTTNPTNKESKMTLTQAAKLANTAGRRAINHLKRALKDFDSALDRNDHEWTRTCSRHVDREQVNVRKVCRFSAIELQDLINASR